MDISELKEELLNNKIRSVYVFTGNELAIQDIYINKIKEISGLNSIRVFYLKEIISKIGSKTLIKIKPSIYIIRNDEEYLRKESAWENLLNIKTNGNIIILLYTDVEKNTKFLKAHESILTNFDYLGGNLLSNRLQATTSMPKQYCDQLVKLCGNSYGRIKNELYKLQMLAYLNNCSLNNTFLQAIKNNDIHEDVGDVIFDFTNSIVNRDIKTAYIMYDKVMQTEDGSALKLLTVLYNSFRQLLIVQSTPSNMRTEECLGMTKGQIYVTSEKCNIYNTFELVNIIKVIRYLEKGIKTGTVAENYAIQYLMGVIW